jgi:hypothetical protein
MSLLPHSTAILVGLLIGLNQPASIGYLALSKECRRGVMKWRTA